MKGIKGTYKTFGDPCANCRRPLRKAIAIRRRPPRKGVLSYCRPCQNARSMKSQNEDPQAHLDRCRTYRQKIRREMIKAYGGKCACCGESIPEFLALDHKKGGGTRMRKLLCNNTSQTMYRLVRDQGYPKSKYQLLCHNCNGAKAWYGGCPHQSP